MIDRKQAIKEYKERKPLRGAFAVRCHATQKAWVGSSMNLSATQNGLWFALRQGAHREATLQAAWNAHGEDAFGFEILEKLDDDVSPVTLGDILKEKKRQWVKELNATMLL
ncbi:MAG TPA: GIY-YIG nuclease family protein [Bryobacteraceae bacterium]|nr:GIY-YIG nuclease family protein [Bryobacteraceae bacterium]